LRTVLGLNRGRGQFLNFLGAPMVLQCKKSIFPVNASLRWLNNVSGVYLTQVSLRLIAQQDLVDFFRIPVGYLSKYL
jgi:hypothetical protein